MSLLSWARRFAGTTLAAGLAALCAHAAAPPASPQQSIDALTRAVQAVVGVQVSATEGARSAETLGRQRSGSEARRDGRRGPAAGRARRRFRAPGIARRPEQRRTDDASTVGKFRHVGLAKNDHPGLAEAGACVALDPVTRLCTNIRSPGSVAEISVPCGVSLCSPT